MVSAATLESDLIVVISLGVIVGMWCERYTIVVMSLRRTHLPSAWGNYHPTFWDWQHFLERSASSRLESFCACAFCQ